MNEQHSTGSADEQVSRDSACWSNNAAEGYANALNRCLGHLEGAAAFLKQNQVVRTQKEMREANLCMNEANIWFNKANRDSFRIKALIDEVTAHRCGVAITYADDNDPVNENWTVRT